MAYEVNLETVFAYYNELSNVYILVEDDKETVITIVPKKVFCKLFSVLN